MESEFVADGMGAERVDLGVRPTKRATRTGGSIGFKLICQIGLHRQVIAFATHRTAG
jgi:hypothetical protein